MEQRDQRACSLGGNDSPPSLAKDRRLTARTRLLTAAFVVVVSAMAGAAYASRATAESEPAQTIVLGSGQRIVGLDLGTLLGNGDQQRQMLALAYERV